MKTTVIRIGNSRGIVIPAALLKKLGIKEGARVLLEEIDGKLILSFDEPEEPFTGPFTGPFKALANLKDDDSWGGDDPLGYAQKLHDSRVNTRETPEW